MSLAQQAALFGVTLTSEHAAAFDLYLRELLAWNAHTNLTAITDPDEIRIRHFLDSLSLAHVADRGVPLRVVDVGSGAGFPGLPLALVFPQLQVTLLEATGKKVAFLEHIIATLKLANATPLKARAEEAGHDPKQRAAYDLALARAVARLPSLLEYLLPLAKPGGLCVAMKGKTAHEEADSARHALAALGGALRSIETVHLPGRGEPHYLIVVEKVAPTPAAYPRKPGVPTHKPL